MQFTQRNSYNLVAMGDSQTAERVGGAAMRETYVSRIAHAKDYGNFVNAGISGHTTTQMLARFSADVLAHRPGAVSLMACANDMTTNISGGTTWVGGGISLATTKANMKSMIGQAQDARAKVTLCSFCPIRETVYLNNAAAYRAMFLELVSETGCEYVDVYAAFLALSSGAWDALYIVGDTNHPNAAGHKFIADLALATDGAFGQLG